MAADRWEHAFALFDAALARPEADRGAFLSSECGDDPRLRQEVESLLEAHGDALGFLSGRRPRTGEAVDQSGSASPILMRGMRLGVFEVESFVGAGGMGEVYRARDTRLDRHVAIKVLSLDAATDPRARVRFAYEARAIARLSHPRICAIHEMGHHDGVDFLVMEYLEGETLAARLRRGRLPLAEAVRTAVEIGEALGAAHAQGIVHRDLKPSNVMLTKSGAKLLDFGLARLRAPAGGGPSTPEGALAGIQTMPGLIMGTLPYMAPEQLDARDVDARADIFAFGTVLYEVITGRKAFEETSQASLISAIMSSDPPAISVLRPLTPPDLDRVIRTCLAKDRDERWASVHDVLLQLEWIASESQPSAAQAPARRRRRWWLAAAPAGALLLAVAVWLRWRPREIELAPPRVVPLSSMHGSATYPTFSPEGGQIAFTWDGEKGDNWDIYLKMIGSPEIRRLTTDPAPDIFPSWSPDGRQIAFVRCSSFADCQGTIHLISPVGGSDRKLSDFPIRWTPSWSPDSRWLAAARYGSATETDPGAAGIYLIPVLGGEPRPMTSAKAPVCHHDPALSPDGHHLAYVSCASCTNFISCHVDVVELGADYVPVGPPRHLTRRAGWIGGLAWTRDGNSLIYGDWTTRRLWRAWIEGDRPPERIELAGLNASEPATAASLDRLAFAHDRSTRAIYRFEVGHRPEALLESSLVDWLPHFSPDGRRITFVSRRGGEEPEVWLAAADGSNRMQLTHGPGIWQGNPRWSPDGHRIAFGSQAEDGQWDIWTINADGGSPRRLTLNPGSKSMPSWSRDGRSIYFQSDRAGAEEVWRIPATGGSDERVTHGGGGLPYESADGKTLFFTRTPFANAPLLALPLAGGPERKVLECVPSRGFAVGPGGVYHLGCAADPRAVPLFLLDPATGQDRLLGKLEQATSYGLTVSPDGKTILYSKDENQGSDLMMIENFR